MGAFASGWLREKTERRSNNLGGGIIFAALPFAIKGVQESSPPTLPVQTKQSTNKQTSKQTNHSKPKQTNPTNERTNEQRNNQTNKQTNENNKPTND